MLGIGIAAVAFAAVVVGQSLYKQDAPAAVRLYPSDAAVVQQGKELYATHCASCHGATLQGEPDWRIRRSNGTLPAPPHDESGHTWHHADALLFQITKQGTEALAGNGYKSNMIGFASILTDEEIIAVLSFIKSSWTPEIQLRHDETNKRAHSKE